MPDVEIVEFAGGGTALSFGVLDETHQAALQIANQGIHLRLIPFDDKLDAPVGKVPHIPIDGISLGHVVRGVAKANALNTAIEVVCTSFSHRNPV